MISRNLCWVSGAAIKEGGYVRNLCFVMSFMLKIVIWVPFVVLFVVFVVLLFLLIRLRRLVFSNSFYYLTMVFILTSMDYCLNVSLFYNVCVKVHFMDSLLRWSSTLYVMCSILKQWITVLSLFYLDLDRSRISWLLLGSCSTLRYRKAQTVFEGF